MQSNVPERALSVGGVFLTLRGDVASFIAYNELTDGYGLEDAFEKCKPIMVAFEDTGEVKRLDRRTQLDLLWSMSATWREDEGWDDKDDLHQNPRKRDSFKFFKRSLNATDLRKLPKILVPLLMESMFPPGEAAPEALDPAERPSKGDPAT